MTLVTFAQFAEKTNIHPSMVTKLKRQGVLDSAMVTPENGKRPKLDLKKALTAYKKNADPNFTKDAPQIKNKNNGNKKKSVRKKGKSGGQSFVDARTKAEIIKAKDRELTYLIRQKKFIEVEKVNRRSYTAGRILRDHLLNIPVRCAAIIAAKTKKKEKEVYHILKNEINKALKECHDSLAKLCG